MEIGHRNPTLADWAKRKDPDGNVSEIVEVLSETNEMLDDLVVIEGNLEVGHQATVRNTMPNVYWRRMNKGVPTSKSGTTQVTEPAAIAEGRNQLDIEIARLSNNGPAFRKSEDNAFVESFNQKISSTLFYGNEASAQEGFTGFMPRYGDLSAGNSDQIIDAGGVGSDNCSILLVGWDESKVFSFFPKGTKAGLESRDLGEQTVKDDDGNQYQAFVSLYTWRLGLCVRDPRYVVRACNIDFSEVVAGNVDLISLMTQMSETLHSMSGRPRFYMPRKLRTHLRNQITNKAKTLTMDEVGGKKVLAFDDIPVRRSDSLLLTEARVV